jgi:DNA-directed RNA polymerase subunit RPC12/RpoP
MALELLQNLLKNQIWFTDLVKNTLLDVDHINISIVRKDNNVEYSVWTKDDPMFAFRIDVSESIGHTTECVRCPTCGLIIPLIGIPTIQKPFSAYECMKCKTIFGEVWGNEFDEYLSTQIHPKDVDDTIVPFYFHVNRRNDIKEILHGHLRAGTNEYWIKAKLEGESNGNKKDS